jgi:arylsulfatase A-like enzyme
VAEFRTRVAALTNTEPEFKNDLGRSVRQVQNHPIYAAMMENLDTNIGRMLAKLKALNLESNTIVVFTSDNGGLSTAEGTPTSNMPLRMGKGWAHEGGVRVPLIVRWPGVTKPGSTSTTPAVTQDFYPTFLSAAGLAPKPGQVVDGMDLLQTLRGEASAMRPIFWHYPHYSNQGGAPHGAVREGDWKLIEWFEDGSVELFNLMNDIGEQKNLAKTQPERAQRLLAQLKQWQKSVNAQMPTPNPDYDPAAGKNPNRNRNRATTPTAE